LLTWLRPPWGSLNGCSLIDARLRVPNCVVSGPQSLHRVRHAGGPGNSPVQDSMIYTKLWCHVTSSAQTHLTLQETAKFTRAETLVDKDETLVDKNQALVDHWSLAKGTDLFWVWCTEELGPNGCRNLDRDAQREVKTHFALTQVGHFC
jgi:hypothetical protein